MYNLCRILQHVVNGFDNVSLAQHHSVIEWHQLVSHVYAQPCHQLYSVTRGFPTPQSGLRHSFRKIRLHRTLNEEQVVVLKIAECTKMKIQQNGHDFTVGQ